MYALAICIARVPEALPDPVYALLSGLNAATVGVIDVSAVKLIEKAISDVVTRAIVLVGGAVTLIWDILETRTKNTHTPMANAGAMTESNRSVDGSVVNEQTPLLDNVYIDTQEHLENRRTNPSDQITRSDAGSSSTHYGFAVLGSVLIAIFGLAFLVILILRGWVSTRDFLIRLALIQAFSGLKCNCRCHLSIHTLIILILIITTRFRVSRHALQQHRPILYFLRVVNAAAVGLVWTAVYPLWESVYLKLDSRKGTSLAESAGFSFAFSELISKSNLYITSVHKYAIGIPGFILEHCKRRALSSLSAQPVTTMLDSFKHAQEEHDKYRTAEANNEQKGHLLAAAAVSFAAMKMYDHYGMQNGKAGLSKV
ncbi:hypothetical protein EW145_g4772 [Phellinidium pouzarii]|uniref:Uncharacterized protein n=1 Tax=Phellinidium pouzarii TaxID=167371 RepID=A0A4S4L3P9_9AGAM|nr:hypothetical protein EW145_g4772 [Phellinidium pouzarii]